MPHPLMKKITLASLLLASLSANAATFYFRQPAVGLQAAPAPAAAPVQPTPPAEPQKFPSLSLSTTALSFGAETDTPSELQSVVLKNTGTAALTVGALSLLGTNATDFRIASDACSGQTLAAGDLAGCSVALQFAPSTVGAKQATLNVPSNDPNGAQLVSLTGTASAPVDPQAGLVSLLMHMEGTEGSTTFVDSALGHTFTRTGTPTISTTASAVGAASAYFPNGNYLNTTAKGTEFQFPGDFTIEAWVNLKNPAASNPQALFGMSSGGSWFDVRWYTTRFQISTNSAGGTDIGGTIAANTWTHLAWVRYNGVIKLYVNGVATGTQISNSNTLGFANRNAAIGSSGGANPFYGNMDELRITKMARYTANFTPTTAPFPNP